MTFDEWWGKYCAICKAAGANWLADAGQLSFKDFYDDGTTPEDAFSDECSYLDAE